MNALNMLKKVVPISHQFTFHRTNILPTVQYTAMLHCCYLAVSIFLIQNKQQRTVWI